MKTLLLVGLMLATGAAATTAEAQQPGIRPQFDLEGGWNAEDRPLQCYRAETDVTCVMVNAGFSHRFALAYVSPTRLEGIVTRRNRAGRCITHLYVTITMTSANTFTLVWRALDGACDLTAGQSGTDPVYTRAY